MDRHGSLLFLYWYWYDLLSVHDFLLQGGRVVYTQVQR